jgi:general secretion pathway protein B
MSFILDALKKSENERQRQIGPSLADIPIRRARADRPWWAVAVAALLVINLGVLLIVLTRNRDDSAEPAPQMTPQVNQPASAPVQGATPPPRAAATPTVAASAPAHVNPAVHSLADEAGVDSTAAEDEPPYDPSIAQAALVPDGPPVVRSVTPPTVAPLASNPTFASRTQANTAANDEILPTNGSLVAGGTNLPDMRLDIHVFSANPRERFIFVNMRKYSEGQTLTEGPVVERITTDGAILNQNGMRFVLPRQ